MTIWQDTNGRLYDDMNGVALSLPAWPKGLTKLTAAQVAALQVPTLAQAQATQIALLTAAYQNAIQQPVSYTSKGGVTKTYQTDQQSIDNLRNSITGCAGLGLTATGIPPCPYWVAFDNTQVPFTVADVQGLAAVVYQQGATAFQHLQTQKAAVNAATTVAAVQAIVW